MWLRVDYIFDIESVSDFKTVLGIASVRYSAIYHGLVLQLAVVIVLSMIHELKIRQTVIRNFGLFFLYWSIIHDSHLSV